jgi:hypothetical protein
VEKQEKQANNNKDDPDSIWMKDKDIQKLKEELKLFEQNVQQLGRQLDW